MRKFFLNLTLLTFASSCFAQDIEVKKFEPLEKDQTEVTNLRNDANGNPCALLVVQSLKDGMDFEGWIVGDVERKDDTYRVYVANGAKHIKIKHADFQTKDVVFGDYGTSSLKGGLAYSLQLVDDTKDIINKVYSMGWNLNDYEVPIAARRLLNTAAAKGDKKAQVAMAQLNMVKNGDSSQNESGYYWVEQLLSKGDSSCVDVMPGELMFIYAEKLKIKTGYQYHLGVDAIRDIYTKACEFELKACLDGYKRAGDVFFEDYPNSNGLSLYNKDVFRLCIDSASIGNVKAISCLGYIYEKGICNTLDVQEASKWYRKAYELSPSNQTKTNLCRVYGNKQYPITETDLNFIKKQAAEGLPEALYQLGYMYEEGRNVPKNINIAMDYYHKIVPEKSYSNRHPKAACRLAEFYYNQKEYKKASSYLIDIDGDDALYLSAIIDYYQSDYNKTKVFKSLNYLSKKGYQRATTFIKENY